MKYLQKFNQRLKSLRDKHHWSNEDIAGFCQVDASIVSAWEQNDGQRVYPSIDNLIDLCLQTGLALETLLDVEVPDDDEGQLELPGLAFIDEADLSRSIDQLQEEVDKVLPTEDEWELLRRYRRSDLENRKLILQLMK